MGSCSTRFETPLDIDLLETWIGLMIQKYGADLYRYKGVLNVEDEDSKYVFQGVGMIYDGSFKGVWGDEKRENRFVFIGKNLDKKGLIEGFHKCKIDAELRFKEGDMVLASGEDGWYPGIVMACWHDGNPYVIQTEDPENPRMVCPFDVDEFCKAPASEAEWVFTPHPR